MTYLGYFLGHFNQSVFLLQEPIRDKKQCPAFCSMSMAGYNARGVDRPKFSRWQNHPHAGTRVESCPDPKNKSEIRAHIPEAAMSFRHWLTDAAESTEECNPSRWNATPEGR